VIGQESVTKKVRFFLVAHLRDPPVGTFLSLKCSTSVFGESHRVRSVTS
jgi:hypothetical protein